MIPLCAKWEAEVNRNERKMRGIPEMGRNPEEVFEPEDRGNGQFALLLFQVSTSDLISGWRRLFESA